MSWSSSTVFKRGFEDICPDTWRLSKGFPGKGELWKNQLPSLQLPHVLFPDVYLLKSCLKDSFFLPIVLFLLCKRKAHSSPTKITVGSDCSHEIKRYLLLRRKAMAKLGNILKSKDINLPAKVHLVKAMDFQKSCMDRASLRAQLIKNLPAMQETWVWFLGWENSLEKERATHSNILAWRIPWTEEPGRLQSMGSQELDMT